MNEKEVEVVKLKSERNLTEDKYMAEAPEKFEDLMDDLDQDLNVVKVEEIQQ